MNKKGRNNRPIYLFSIQLPRNFRKHKKKGVQKRQNSDEEDFNQYVIFKSSVRIYNPGSIYKNIDPMSFASSKVGSKLRNILIASVLYKCGYIDAFGTGFDRTFTLCDRNGVGYEYNNDEFGFTFIFKRDPGFLNDEKHDDNNDKINDRINDKINSIDRTIIFSMEKNKYITIPDISLAVNKSEPTVYRHISNLVKAGLVRRIGSRKSGHWSVV